MTKGRQGLVAAGILVLGLLLFAPGIDNGFRADDFSFLTAVARVSAPGELLAPGQDLAFYRPLALGLFWLEYRLFGSQSAYFLLVNIGLHLLNALLLWRLARRLGLPEVAAGSAALGFALGVFHYGKQVGWACTGGGLLAVTLILTALLLDAPPPGRRPWRLPLLLLIAVAAPLAHEIGLVLPLLLFARRACEGAPRGRSAIEASALLLIGGGIWLAGNLALEVKTPGSTLAAAGIAPALLRYLGYAGLMLLPLQDSLTLRESLPLALPLLAAMEILRPLLGALALAAALSLGMRRGPAGPRFLAIWALLALLPFAMIPTPSGWLDLRYLYPAALPTTALVALLLLKIGRRRPTAAIALVAVLLAMSLGLTLLLERGYHRQGEAERPRLEEWRRTLP